MADDNELTGLLSRGFAGVAEQLRERDRDVTKLSESMIRMEGELKYVKEVVARMDAEISRSESVGIGIRVGNLEEKIKVFQEKQDANATWIRGLLVSVVLLLIGFIINFFRISVGK